MWAAVARGEQGSGLLLCMGAGHAAVGRPDRGRGALATCGKRNSVKMTLFSFLFFFHSFFYFNFIFILFMGYTKMGYNIFYF